MVLDPERSCVKGKLTSGFLRMDRHWSSERGWEGGLGRDVVVSGVGVKKGGGGHTLSPKL